MASCFCAEASASAAAAAAAADGLFGPEENPQKEIQSRVRSKKARRLRWGHLYLPALPDLYGSAPNWRSLIIPGTLPLTTDYFPSKRERSKKFLEYFHRVSLIPGENCYNDNTMELLAELMCQRYNQEYQLVDKRESVETGGSPHHGSLQYQAANSPTQRRLRNVSKGDFHSDMGSRGLGFKHRRNSGHRITGEKLDRGIEKDNETPSGGLHFQFSFRCEYQEIRYDPDVDSVSINRYVPRSRTLERRIAMGSVEFPYRAMVWNELLGEFMLRGVTIKASHEDYNWNHTDQLIAGYHTDFARNSKAKELAITLLPSSDEAIKRKRRSKLKPAVSRDSIRSVSRERTDSNSHDKQGILKQTGRDALLDGPPRASKYHSENQIDDAAERLEAHREASKSFQEWIESVTGKSLSELNITILPDPDPPHDDEIPVESSTVHPNVKRPRPKLVEEKERKRKKPPIRQSVCIFLGPRPDSNTKKKSKDNGDDGLQSNPGQKRWKWGRMERQEWFRLEYDTYYHPKCAFSLSFSWLVLSGARLREWLASARRRANRRGLRMISIPVEFQGVTSEMFSSPFYCPIEVPLSRRSRSHSFSERAAAYRIVKDFLEKELGFVGVLGRHLWMHKTGMATVSWSPTRQSVYWYNNYMFEGTPFRQESRQLFWKLRHRLRSLEATQVALQRCIGAVMNRISD
mmetsp:Transcript_15235/g.37371  ORF Transcript_15235/g.37371 Transcript_15235/m.37371 type:complete len:688 (-) Transcript_15235:81-2144(-)